MICYECMEYIDIKMFCCNCCYEGMRYKELVVKSNLSKAEKEEMFSYKRIMDCQNKKIQEMLMKLFKQTGINIFT